MIQTDLSGFGVTMHLGLCEQYLKSLGLMAFLFHMHPHELWQQTPPELVLILLWRRLNCVIHTDA